MSETQTEPEKAVELDLMPRTPIESKVDECRVPIAHIVLNGHDAEPTKAMRDSVARSGVLLSVVLKRTGRNRYEVKDGIRRIKAAAMAEQEDVPARVLDFRNASHEAAVTLITNLHRSSNAVEELRAIEGLLTVEGGSPETIASELGIPLATIKRRLKLTRLTQSARAAFDAGYVPVAVAERLSALKAATQNKLVKAAERVVEKEEKAFRITADDVRGEKMAAQTKIAASMPQSMFTPETSKANKKASAGPKFTAADLVVAVFAEEDSRREVVAEALERLLAEAYEQGELDKTAGPSRTHDTGKAYARMVVKGHVERARAEGRIK